MIPELELPLQETKVKIISAVLEFKEKTGIDLKNISIQQVTQDTARGKMLVRIECIFTNVNL